MTLMSWIWDDLNGGFFLKLFKLILKSVQRKNSLYSHTYVLIYLEILRYFGKRSVHVIYRHIHYTFNIYISIHNLICFIFLYYFLSSKYLADFSGSFQRLRWIMMVINGNMHFCFKLKTQKSAKFKIFTSC